MALVQVLSTAGDQAQPGVTAAAAQATGTTPRWQVVVLSFAAIAVAWLLSIVINATYKPVSLVVAAGIGLFATLYAVSQGLERLLEPISSFFFATKTTTQNRNATLAAAMNLQAITDEEVPARLTELAKAARVTQDLQGKPAWEPPATPGRLRRNVASDGVTVACARVADLIVPPRQAPGTQDGSGAEDPPGSGGASGTGGAGTDPGLVVKRFADSLQIPEGEAPGIIKRAAVDLAAAAQAELNQRRADKAVAYWALASILGLLLSGTLGLYLLHIVGLRGDGLRTDGIWSGGILTATGTRHMIDLLITGLAIGGGTKPLHDLISNLQAAKNSKKDPSQTQ